jgi:hypothetical protein
MYELPEQTPGSRFVMTPDVVEGRERLFKLPETKSA